MACKVNTFKVVMIIAGCVCVVAMTLQIAGISIDYLHSWTLTSGITRYWGLWNHCYSTPYVIRNITYHDTKCYSLVNSDEHIIKIIGLPSLWKFFQATNVISLMFLVAVFFLIFTQLCCLKYNKKLIVAAVFLSAIAGSLILIGCIAYVSIKNSVPFDNGQLEYAYYLLVAAGVLAIISVFILNVARLKFPKDQTRPSSNSVTPARPLGPDQNTNHSRSSVYCVPSGSMPPEPPRKLGMHIGKSTITPLAIYRSAP